MLRILILIILIGLSSCASHKKHNSSQAHTQPQEESYFYPPFSPISLSVDSTLVYIQDFFPLAQHFEITHLPAGLEAHTHLDNFTLKGTMIKAHDHLNIKVDGIPYVLVIKNHGKIKYNFYYRTLEKKNNLQFKSDFNNWNPEANPFSYFEEEGSYYFTTWLKPGIYQYILMEDGKEFLDDTNPLHIDNGIGGKNNVLEVDLLNRDVTKNRVSHYDQEEKRIWVTQIRNDYSNFNPEAFLIMWQNQLVTRYKLEKQQGNQVTLSIPIPEEAAKHPRSFLRVFSTEAIDCNDLLIPLQYDSLVEDASTLHREEYHDNVMYEVFVDRFYDGNPANNRPINSKELFPGTDWYGGDLQGLQQKMDQGYFQDLGVNALWISPISENPEGMYGHMTEYGVDTKFTGYHGYWPVSLSKIDPRFGDEKTLKKVIQTAHQDDTNIFLDYVANHVHQEHPIVKNKMGWTTPMYLADGRKNNRIYEEQRLTTWFDDFMPTLDLEKEEVAEAMSDSALYWFKNYDIDGFRHDATKHIPNSFWRKLTYKTRTQIIIPEHRSLYQIGETYGGNELIGSYINTGMLDAQFDFNLFDAAKNGILNDEYPLSQTAAELKESLDSYGYHHLMGNISGNHDKGRSISYADGSIAFNEDAKEAGYTRKIENINGDIGYRKMAQFFAFTMFIPGIPVIYYGDEIGMPGGDDPDNRRMMQFDELNSNQSQLKNTVSQLAHLRRNRMELLFGDTYFGDSTEDSMVLIRTYLGKTSVLLLNTSDSPKSFRVPSEVLMDGDKCTAQFGNSCSIKEGVLTSEIPARGFDILRVE